MQFVAIEISRFLGYDPQPGVVECTLIDAHGVSHVFVEKVAVVVGTDNLGSDSIYPQPGEIACKVEASWKDDDGRSLVRVNTEYPWHVESTQGTTCFDVLSSRISQRE